MREALVYRGLARLYKYTYPKKHRRAYAPLTTTELALIPENEQSKICDDLSQADYIDFTDLYVKQLVQESVLDYCSKKKAR